MKSKYIIYFYFISIFLIANGSFANFIFTSLHFSVWRQCIWFFGLFLVFKYTSFFGDVNLKRLVRRERNYFIIILILSLVTVLTYEFNIVRIVYAWWQYFCGLPFVLFPFFLKHAGWDDNKVAKVFIYFGLFQTIGLLLDYLSGGFFTVTFQVRESTDGLLENGRYCFLAETPSTFGIYYCLCLVMTLKEILYTQSFVKKLLLLFLSMSYVIGAWFTGSRQIVAALLIVLIVALYLLYRRDRRIRVPMLTIIFVSSLFFPLVMGKLYQEDAYSNRYSASTIQEDERVNSWRMGFEYCIGEMNIKRILLGEAVGFVSGQKALDNEATGFHFENSYWARMSETGLVGLGLFLLPFWVLLKKMNRERLSELLYFSFMLSFLFTSYVSPNGASTTAQMSIFLILGFFLSEQKQMQ